MDVDEGEDSGKCHLPLTHWGTFIKRASLGPAWEH